MDSPAKNTLLTIRKIQPALICYYICYYLYILFVVQIDLIYQAFGRLIKFPEFSTGSSFLSEHLSRLGGLFDYAAGFLSQCYYYPWLGALVITAIAVAFTVCLMIILSSTPTKIKALAYFVPAILILIPLNRYDHQLPAMLSILLAVVAFTIYTSISTTEPLRIVLWMGMFAAMYYLAGGTCFFFAVMTAIYEVLSRRSILRGLILSLIAVGTYAVGLIVFDHRAEMIFLRGTSAQAISDEWIKVSVWGLYIFFMFVLTCMGIADRFKKSGPSSKKTKKHKTKKQLNPLQRLNQNGILQIAVCLIVIGATTATVCHYSFDRRKQNDLRISYYASHRMWNRLLEKAETLQTSDFNKFINHDVNRALYHTGRLCDDMFRFPQRLEALILSGSEGPFSANTFAKRCDLFLDIGHVGMARRLDYEALEVSGNSPYVLKRLALINLAKGQTEAAKVILNALSNDIIFGSWAENYLNELDSDPEQNNNEVIVHIRSIMSEKDNMSIAMKADDFFVQLLAKNQRNKMAFEYMMAYFLLTRQVDKISTGLGVMEEMGYESIPRYLEEAIAVYMISGGKVEDFYGYTVSDATLSKMKTFDKLFVQFGGKRNREAAEAKLAKNYSDSYIFYYAFGKSGVSK